MVHNNTSASNELVLCCSIHTSYQHGSTREPVEYSRKKGSESYLPGGISRNICPAAFELLLFSSLHFHNDSSRVHEFFCDVHVLK
ncbi:hypothetical protein AVEN_110089-1 [Araneus ventricosus]|uniref:Uncharacterized protein n=1 Tax=Araneus ventricosus TaxID=182803 RepID=A0A4Y2PPD4_ARAVE|nr:hypothetical protein AVEN_110089-1 [Araneus ventricosus]